MVVKKLVFCLCLITWSCTPKGMPEPIIQQATKPRLYHFPPEHDITIQEAQNWLTQHEYKRQGTYVLEKQLDWKLAEDQGNFIELPFKRTYQGPTISNLFNADELAKLDVPQTEWRFFIGKLNNNYFLSIKGFFPFKGVFIPHTTYGNLQTDLKQIDGAYLELYFDVQGHFVDGIEVNNSPWKSSFINPGTKKFPSTDLEEIKREMYEDSLKAR